MDSTVVIDYGSKALKAGLIYNFPSEEEPRVVTPNLVEVSGAPDGAGSSGSQLVQPVQAGRIVDFDALEAMLHYSFYEMLAWQFGNEGSVVVAEPLLTPKADREQLAQLMFEVFNTSGMFVQDQASLALYAVGRLGGCVVDIGHEKTDVSTVSEGQVNAPSIRRLPFGGRELTRLLGSLRERGGKPALAEPALEQLKELCMRTSAEAAGRRSSAAAADAMQVDGAGKSYTLPDGQVVEVNEGEGEAVADALFDPSLLGHADCPGVCEAVVEAVHSHTEAPLRKTLFENVFVCGGGAAAPGVGPRVVAEVRAGVPPSITPALCAPPEYMPSNTLRYGPWVGGAVLAKVVLQQNQLVTKGDYEEIGPYAMYKKCS